MSLQNLLTIGKIVGIAIIGGVLGIGVGIGISKLGGDDSGNAGDLASATTTTTIQIQTATTPRRAKTSTVQARTSTSTTPSAPPPTTTTPPPAAAGPPPTASRAAGAVRVHVLSAILHPASTSSGRRRKRARVGVHVRVTNHRSTALKALFPAMLGPGETAIRGRLLPLTAGTLLPSVGPGVRADGRVRFEIAGALTDATIATGKLRLRIAGVTVPVEVRVGPPVSHRN